MLLATIKDTVTGREELLMKRHAWHLCPYVLGYKTVCGYYESRFDLFTFACDVAGMDYEAAEWIDAATGEVLDYYALCDEESELFDTIGE